ncbi:hypothetical protein [Pseudobutyrivibrio ruminis]|uniref:Uncharacterized protein n=1 Tax=Pseudobutyrivibrio ruminis DSM 9787 TaxID=1123011 RepID=A0A285SKP6_9FIRM|nr:hypothetical protein [Pseudobutyrivibrio ruminis]SOC08224.1 hypothetical protein SAMN02910411_2445 [Pseudobutyrivibrio ruminis DSM 9787]
MSKTNNSYHGVFLESDWRHRVLSDEKIKFFRLITDNSIHDKTCKLIQKYPDRDIICLNEYDEKLSQCKACATKAYLRIGATDPKNYKRYCTFFDNTFLSTKVLRDIYVTNRMTTSIFENTLTIKYKEDTWRIISLDNDGNVQLRHNNYKRLTDGTRQFVGGYHIQNNYCKRIKIRPALSVIKTYDYRVHSTNDNILQAVDKNNKIAPKHSPISRIFTWIKSVNNRVKRALF